jgi:hypothetical protein
MKKFAYKLNCNNCESTSDSILRFKISKVVNPENSLFFEIENLKEDIIIFDERYFVTTYNNYVVQNPIGLNNPNLLLSWTNNSTSTIGESSQYFYNPLGNYYSKYNSQIGLTRSITESTVQQPYIILPGKSKIIYYLNDYLKNLFEIKVRKKTYSENENINIKWEEVKNEINSMQNADIKYTVVYRLINEEKWRNFTLSVNPFDLEILTKVNDDDLK